MSTPSDLSGLLAAERAVRPPPAAVEHGLQRLLSDLAAQAAPMPIASGALKLGWSALSKWILTGFVVGVAGSGAAAKLWSPAPPAPRAQAALVAPSVALAVAPTDLLERERPAPSSAPSAEQPSVTRPSQAVTAALPPVPSSQATTFDAELRLINLAKGELDAGRPHLAEVWLAEHATRFPTGVFATDRQALRVLAGCAQHRDAALAREFAAKHPHSPMLERLQRACSAGADTKSPNETAPLEEPTRK